jgi:interleukin-1 receptor-associated kinase 1/coatomer subunit beta'
MIDERHNTREVPTDFPWNLVEDITNGFAVEQKIGSGGYGVVYKGVHPNGQEVAVKKLHHMPGLDEDQFQNELRILTGIRHPNIVQLVGKNYIERDRCIEHRGRLVFATMIDRAICLEFLPGGSLEKHLSDERFGLRWHSRYKIIKGICDGLKHLHGERIFHLDPKPGYDSHPERCSQPGY